MCHAKKATLFWRIRAKPHSCVFCGPRAARTGNTIAARGPPVVEEVVQDSLLIMITGGAVFWRIQYIAGPGRPRAAGLTPGSTGQTICMIYCFGGFVRNRTSVRERMIVHFSPILVCARTLASKTGLHRLPPSLARHINLTALARLAGRARSALTARSLVRSARSLAWQYHRRSERASEPIYMSRQSMVHLSAASGRGRCSIEARTHIRPSFVERRTTGRVRAEPSNSHSIY